MAFGIDAHRVRDMHIYILGCISVYELHTYIVCMDISFALRTFLLAVSDLDRRGEAVCPLPRFGD